MSPDPSTPVTVRATTTAAAAASQRTTPPTATATNTCDGASFPSITPSPSNVTMTTTGESDDNGGTARSLCSSSSSPSPSRGDDDDNHATVVVLRVTDRDVLCGRGMGIRRHPGNVVYNDLLRASHEAYKTAPKGSKAKIVEGIVRYVREGRQQPDGNGGDVEKGRFLERRPNRGGGDDDDRWIFVDIGHERAMLKTVRCLFSRSRLRFAFAGVRDGSIHLRRWLPRSDRGSDRVDERMNRSPLRLRFSMEFRWCLRAGRIAFFCVRIASSSVPSVFFNRFSHDAFRSVLFRWHPPDRLRRSATSRRRPE